MDSRGGPGGHNMNDPYWIIANEPINMYNEDKEQDTPNFFLQTAPSLNYITFKPSPQNDTSSQAGTSPQQNPNPSSIQDIPIQQPSTTNAPECPDIDFLNDDYELYHSQDSELGKLLDDINQDYLAHQNLYNYNHIPDIETVLNQQIHQVNEVQEPKVAVSNDKFRTRFIEHDEKQRQVFIEERENKNTKRKMTYNVNTFKEFLAKIKDEKREIYEIRPTDLDIYLQEFFVGIRKETKNENEESNYQPGTLTGYHSMINKYLKLNNYAYDIMKDPLFEKSRECLKAKKKHLKQLGLGNLPHAAEAIDSEEEEELFASGAFGSKDADSLTGAMWYFNTLQFGLRGSDEHRKLKWGDIKLYTDGNGESRLVYNERDTKTRDGSNTKDTRAYAPKSWNKTHVAMYLEFMSHRPSEMCEKDAPFYLGVNRLKNAKHWYKAQPMGERTLSSIMKTAASKSNIDRNKKITNHSGRKTAVQRLIDEGMPVTAVQQHSGHKNIASINNYAKNSLKTQKKMSNILAKNYENDEIVYVPPVNKTKKCETAPNPESENILPVSPKPHQNEVKPKDPSDLFPKGTIINGGTFNFVFRDLDYQENMKPKAKRRRPQVIESDSD